MIGGRASLPKRLLGVAVVVVLVSAASASAAVGASVGSNQAVRHAGTAPAPWIFDLDAHPTIQPDQDQLSTVLERLMIIGQAANPEAQLSISLRVGPYAIEINGDQHFSSASVAKLYWAVSAVDSVGTDPLEDLAAAVFTYSDNSAAGRLIDVSGVDRINEFTGRLGMSATYLSVWAFDHGRYATDRAQRGDSNTTSTNDLTAFLDKLRHRELLDGQDTARVLEWMRQTPDAIDDSTGYGGMLTDRLPSPVAAQTMHKAGWLPPDCCHEVEDLAIAGGLVPLPDGSAFSLAVAAAGGSDYEGQVEWVGLVACSIYSTLVDSRSCDHRDPSD